MGEKWYADHLKINKWKDFLPQHIGKDGFSKDHLDDVSIEYLDEFILETCRGEWNHIANCYFAVVLFIINPFWTAFILTILLFLGNLPFAIIQRYNRFRLVKLKNTLMEPSKILFVCLGNICRSSSAEGVMKHLVSEAGLEDQFVIDSAGILSYHQGELPDSRMRAHAIRRGYNLIVHVPCGRKISITLI